MENVTHLFLFISFYSQHALDIVTKWLSDALISLAKVKTQISFYIRRVTLTTVL